MTIAETNTLKNTRMAKDDADIHTKITKLKNEASILGASLAETSGVEAKRVLEKGEELAHDAVVKSREALDYVSSELEMLEAQLVKRVRERPIQSMGIAIGAGVLLALMLRK
jgi:ElaB/YqjD/DUF883 family membrane-anchored ribosome-binding protein